MVQMYFLALSHVRIGGLCRAVIFAIAQLSCLCMLPVTVARPLLMTFALRLCTSGFMQARNQEALTLSVQRA